MGAGGPRPSDLSLALIWRTNHLTSVASRSSTNLDNLHHWSVLCHPRAISWFHAPTSMFAISSTARDKVVFGMLRVKRWVESRAPGLKPLPALSARDKPFTTLLSELKEFSSFFMVLSHPFSQITCLHVSTRYPSISFDRMISALDRCSSLLEVWTNLRLPHYLLHWHHQVPATLSWVATCLADIGFDSLTWILD